MTLPLLPEPATTLSVDDNLNLNFRFGKAMTIVKGATFFTAEQMRAFYELGRSNERERAAQQLDALGCDHCAAAIRKTP